VASKGRFGSSRALAETAYERSGHRGYRRSSARHTPKDASPTSGPLLHPRRSRPVEDFPTLIEPDPTSRKRHLLCRPHPRNVLGQHSNARSSHCTNRYNTVDYPGPCIADSQRSSPTRAVMVRQSYCIKSQACEGSNMSVPQPKVRIGCNLNLFWFLVSELFIFGRMLTLSTLKTLNAPSSLFPRQGHEF
jgi:hypothetical protein